MMENSNRFVEYAQNNDNIGGRRYFCNCCKCWQIEWNFLFLKKFKIWRVIPGLCVIFSDLWDVSFISTTISLSE